MIDRSLVWTGDLNAQALEPQPRVTVGIFDMTLLGAKQAPGLVLSPEDEARLAAVLDEAGIDRILAVVPEDGSATIELLLAAGLQAEVWGLARATPDVETLLGLGVGGCVVEVPVSDVQLAALQMSREALLQQVRAAISLAAEQEMRVAFAAGDATRAPLDAVRRSFEIAVEFGAVEVVVADTLGIATPEAAAFLVGDVADRLGPEVAVHWHGHDDFGLATASAVAAVQAGATWVHAAVDGVGERAGTADLGEVALALEALYGIPTRLRLDRLRSASELLRELADVCLSPWKAVSGESLFVHESESAARRRREPGAIEPYSAELTGTERRHVLGASSGLESLRIKLDELGLELSEERWPDLCDAVHKLARRKRGLVTDAELRRLVGRMRG